MAEDYKKIVKELDKLIKRAPDLDMDLEFGFFLKNYENELRKCDQYVEGLLPRLIFIMDFIRFQTNTMLGGDLKESLQSLMTWAEDMDHGDVPMNFSNLKRMTKMKDILEEKAHTIRCNNKEQIERWAQ